MFICGFAVLSFGEGYIENNVLMFGPKAGHAHNQEVTASLLVTGQPVSIAFTSVISNVLIKYI